MSSTATDPFTAEWQAWHAERERGLSAEHGWLSLAALHWLEDRPAPLPGLPGDWWHDRAGVHIDPGAAADDRVQLNGEDLIGPATVWRPEDGQTGRITHGPRLIEILYRGPGNLGLRIRDPEAPTRTGFTGVPTFTPDPAWRLPARYVPYPTPKAEETGSASTRVSATHELRGQVSFQIDGEDYSLQVGPGMALAFRDATSGTETFGLLRHLRLIETDDGVVVDFNRAVNPPCAFTDYGTCPLPPAQNVLPIAIRAGERVPVRA